ncbi:MAG: hypothetical protein H0W22_06835 [Chloroflexi bacterium]|nr:hypothetical protein [Chloroflexota bacterium]
MAAYAVIARIERVAPHLAGWPGSEHVDALDRSVVEAVGTAEIPEIIERPFAPGLAERWADMREAWAQATFYLLNVESWR